MTALRRLCQVSMEAAAAEDDMVMIGDSNKATVGRIHERFRHMSCRIRNSIVVPIEWLFVVHSYLWDFAGSDFHGDSEGISWWR